MYKHSSNRRPLLFLLLFPNAYHYTHTPLRYDIKGIWDEGRKDESVLCTRIAERTNRVGSKRRERERVNKRERNRKEEEDDEVGEMKRVPDMIE